MCKYLDSHTAGETSEVNSGGDSGWLVKHARGGNQLDGMIDTLLSLSKLRKKYVRTYVHAYLPNVE